MKQTAVEWYELKIKQLDFFVETRQITWKEYYNKKDKLFEQAKEMEKEQTLKFGIKCQLDFIKSDGIRSVEDIWEETFNTREK